MGRTRGIDEVLSLDTVNYLIVRPHRGMRDGIEVINAFNQDRMRQFPAGKREEAIEYAQKEAARSRSFDHVLAVFPPERPDDSDENTES